MEKEDGDIVFEQGKTAQPAGRMEKEDGDIVSEQGKTAQPAGRMEKEDGDIVSEQGKTAQPAGRTEKEDGDIVSEQEKTAQPAGRTEKEDGDIVSEQGKTAQLAGNVEVEYSVAEQGDDTQWREWHTPSTLPAGNRKGGHMYYDDYPPPVKRLHTFPPLTAASAANYQHFQSPHLLARAVDHKIITPPGVRTPTSRDNDELSDRCSSYSHSDVVSIVYSVK